ncbi:MULTISPECIES: endonuclease/exonuclease/phosphatase family protein [unclassified Enterococcus]|uniref:endonuclease/exonuclease/phosphatase family protein n=1 Tax=unclassified Enterococcus TaxID=2608891 RepID=UPI0013E9E5DC|nr:MULTISPECIES: endonuclease/exonuclease/phosphatase family protein [unclassified Enterococcus]
MKLMTVNTHSWLEQEPLEKLEQLAKKIQIEQYDVIGLQEINQLIDSESVTEEELSGFCPVENQTPIHQDNFVYCLIKRLRELGEEYFWSWEMSHIGYDIYEEGNALLSRTPLESEALLVSESQEKENYRTRKLLVGKTFFQGKEIIAASCHFSWWEDEKSGFAYEWAKSQKHLSRQDTPIFLLGDFNNPSGESGYQLVEKSVLHIQDAFTKARKTIGEATIEKTIDGWENNNEKLRIDYIFVPENREVLQYQVIFDGKQEAIISDHFGVAVKLGE